MKSKIFILIALLLSSWWCLADTAQDIYAFPTTQQQYQFNNLTQKLRCLVCQNESLADSNAPLAQDLRNTIAQMILQKKSNQEIIAYLVDRYGDFVLYQPRLTDQTLLLWLIPPLLLLIGVLLLGVILLPRGTKS